MPTNPSPARTAKELLYSTSELRATGLALMRDTAEGNQRVVAVFFDDCPREEAASIAHACNTHAAHLARIAELEAALGGLLDYSGGFDLTDPAHPIFQARSALHPKGPHSLNPSNK